MPLPPSILPSLLSLSPPQTISTFYREVVLPALDARARADPAAALQLPDLLVEMFFAFARLFEAAAR